MGESAAETSTLLPLARPLPRGWLTAAGAALVAVGILFGFIVTRYFKPASLTTPPAVRTTVRLEPGHWLDGERVVWYDQRPTRTAISLSSDSRFMVYSAVKENPGNQDQPRLYLRRLDQLEAKPIAGTEGGCNPFLSPDDRWVGFWGDRRRKLMKVSVDGGVPVQLCDVSWLFFGADWGADSHIYFAQGEMSGHSRISADGGELETLTKPDRKEEFSHRLPHCLPTGKGILFTIMKNDGDMEPRLAVLDLATRKWHVLLQNAADGRFAGTGHLVFLRRGTLMAASFDLDRMEVKGQPVPAVAGILQALNVEDSQKNTAAGQFSLSSSGSLAYAPGGINPNSENSLVWVDHQGKAEAIAPFKAPFAYPRLSPDARSIAYTTSGMDQQVWVYNLDRGTATKITMAGIAAYPTWMPDGTRIIFSWHKVGPFNLYWMLADGSSPMERLTTSEYSQAVGSVSPDGPTLSFIQSQPDGGEAVMTLGLQDRKVTPFLNSRFSAWHPEFSPDGRWMAYASDESGRFEVYVQPYPGPGSKTQVSSERGRSPMWSRNGKQLFYWQGPKLWAVDVQIGSVFSAGKPRLLFEQEGYGTSDPIRNWDISPDGQRFLMVKWEESKPQPVTEFILVQNWFEELNRLVPSGKKQFGVYRNRGVDPHERHEARTLLGYSVFNSEAPYAFR